MTAGPRANHALADEYRFQAVDFDQLILPLGPQIQRLKTQPGDNAKRQIGHLGHQSR